MSHTRGRIPKRQAYFVQGPFVFLNLVIHMQQQTNGTDKGNVKLKYSIFTVNEKCLEM